MKIKTTFIIAFILISMSSIAQSQFDKFEDLDGVSSVIVNKKAFTLMGKIGEESDEEYLDLIKNIDNLRVFATESATVAAQMSSEVKKYLNTANLEELMRVKDKGSNVVIYVKEGKTDDFVKELFMYVEDGEGQTGKESVIVSLTGNIDLRQISKLTSKMNIPGGEHLEKANK